MIQPIPSVSVPPKGSLSESKPIVYPANLKISELAKGVFTVLSTPGFFSTPEFYRSAEVVFGTISCLGAVAGVIYIFAGKMDSASLSGVIVVTGAAGAHLAGQAAIGKSLQEKLEKMENLNEKQATQIAHYQVLFKDFKKEIDDFKEFNAENQTELSGVIQKFQQQIQASSTLIHHLFKDEKEILDILKTIKEVKDPETFLRRLQELQVVTTKLQESQKELANTEGRLEMVIEDLRKMEEAHQKILDGHKEVLAAHNVETNKLQAAIATLTPKQSFMFA